MHFKNNNVLNKLLYTYRQHRWSIRLFVMIFLVLATLIISSSVLAMWAEHKGEGSHVIHNLADAVWWSIVTIASVGYGDKYPVTPAGRLVGVLLIGLGITVLSMFTGLVASIFVEDRLKGAKGLKNITETRHVVICGWNDAAENMLRSLAERLEQNKTIVLVGNYTLDFFESLQARFNLIDMKFVRGEPSQEEVLRRANVPDAHHIFILADNSLESQSADDRVVIIANAVHFLVNDHKRITVQLLSPNNKNLLRRLGIENILIYEELGGFILANNAMERNALNLYENLLRDKKNVVQTMMIPSLFIGRTYVELFEYMYQHEGHLMLGIYTEQPTLGLQDIFSDDDSGIDSFIRHALEKSQALGPEIKSNIQIHPPKNYIIQANDKALLIC